MSTVAQLVVLEPLHEPSAPLCVANTHLFFHPRAAHIRTMCTAAIVEEGLAFMQVCSLDLGSMHVHVHPGLPAITAAEACGVAVQASSPSSRCCQWEDEGLCWHVCEPLQVFHNELDFSSAAAC